MELRWIRADLFKCHLKFRVTNAARWIRAMYNHHHLAQQQNKNSFVLFALNHSYDPQDSGRYHLTQVSEISIWLRPTK